jgi:hypothetical protein
MQDTLDGELAKLPFPIRPHLLRYTELSPGRFKGLLKD